MGNVINASRAYYLSITLVVMLAIRLYALGVQRRHPFLKILALMFLVPRPPIGGRVRALVDRCGYEHVCLLSKHYRGVRRDPRRDRHRIGLVAGAARQATVGGPSRYKVMSWSGCGA